MKLETFAYVCDRLSATRSGNNKRDVVSNIYSRYLDAIDAIENGENPYTVVDDVEMAGDTLTAIVKITGILPEDLTVDSVTRDMEIFTRFVSGDLFQDPERNTNFKDNGMRSVVARVSGLTEEEVEELEREAGKTSEAVEKALEKAESGASTQQRLGDISSDGSEIQLETISDLYEQIERLPGADGNIARENIVEDLLDACPSPKSAKWVSHVILDDIAMYMSWKTCAKAASDVMDPSQDDFYRAKRVNHGDFTSAFTNYVQTGTLRTDIEVGTPFDPMLADEQELDEITDEWIGQPKFDGARVLIHCDGDDLRIFTRNCKEITESLPEIHEAIDPNGTEFIVDGEAVGYHPETGEVLPFEKTMNRLRREHDIEDTRKEVEIQTWLFDCIHYESLVDHLSFDERYKILDGVFAENHLPSTSTKQWAGTNESHKSNGLIHVAPNIQDLEVAFDTSLEADHEGIIAKDPNSTYILDRDEVWSKVKPTSDVSLIVSGYQEGTGQYARDGEANWLGALSLETGDGVQIGKVGTGFTDEDREELSADKKDSIVGRIVDVTAEEIQETDEGYGIRFARFIRFRDESEAEPDSLDRCVELLN